MVDVRCLVEIIRGKICKLTLLRLLGEHLQTRRAHESVYSLAGPGVGSSVRRLPGLKIVPVRYIYLPAFNDNVPRGKRKSLRLGHQSGTHPVHKVNDGSVTSHFCR